MFLLFVLLLIAERKIEYLRKGESFSGCPNWFFQEKRSKQLKDLERDIKSKRVGVYEDLWLPK